MQLAKFRSWIIPLIPAFIILGIFFIGPAVWAIYISLTNMALTGPTALHWDFVGLENYFHIGSDPQFLTSLYVTVYFLFGSIIGQLVLGLLLAMYLKNKSLSVRLLVESLAIIAWIMPEVVGGFCWLSFLNYPGGLANIILHISQPVLFTHPLLSVTIANIWHGTAFSLLMFIAALDGVPKEIIEAAKIDGSTATYTFFHIIIPLIKNSIFTDLILITLFTMGEFTLVFTMTGGGPGVATSLLSIYAYQQAFSFYDVSYGSAISIVMLLIGMIISFIYVISISRSEK
ncbi:MAG: carbohydrate ABC transporter permease [bacterium]